MLKDYDSWKLVRHTGPIATSPGKRGGSLIAGYHEVLAVGSYAEMCSRAMAMTDAPDTRVAVEVMRFDGSDVVAFDSHGITHHGAGCATGTANQAREWR